MWKVQKRTYRLLGLLCSIFIFGQCIPADEVLSLVVQGYQEAQRERPAAPKGKTMVHFDRIVDGDTFWATHADGTAFKVRLIGVDAPESRNTGKKKKHPFGVVSKQYLAELLTANPDLYLSFDVDSLDRYGRTLAYVYLANDIMVNEILLQEGYARVMTVPPNVAFQDLFLRAQQQGRAGQRGLWKDL